MRLKDAICITGSKRIATAGLQPTKENTLKE